MISKTNTEDPQKFVPTPIKKSLVRNPTNILPIAKTIKCIVIKKEES